MIDVRERAYTTPWVYTSIFLASPKYENYFIYKAHKNTECLSENILTYLVLIMYEF